MGKEGEPLELSMFADRLGERVPVRRDELGDGHSFTLARGQNQRPVSVEVFPETQVVRIHTPLTDVTLRRAHVEHQDDQNVLWLGGQVEDDWVKAMLMRGGKVVFVSYPTLQEEPQLAEVLSPTGREEDVSLVPTEHAAAPAGVPSPEQRRGDRLEWQGRIGKEPRFGPRKRDGRLIYSFEVTVPDEQEGAESWRTVYFYDERAEKLQGQFHRGQEVRVIAYRNEYLAKDPKTGALTKRESFQGARVIPLDKRADEEARQ